MVFPRTIISTQLTITGRLTTRPCYSWRRASRRPSAIRKLMLSPLPYRSSTEFKRRLSRRQSFQVLELDQTSRLKVSMHRSTRWTSYWVTQAPLSFLTCALQASTRHRNFQKRSTNIAVCWLMEILPTSPSILTWSSTIIETWTRLMIIYRLLIRLSVKSLSFWQKKSVK